jgi:hypothetical protein
MTYDHFYNIIKNHLRQPTSEGRFADPKDETLNKMRQQLLQLINQTNAKITMENVIRIEDQASDTNDYCHWLAIYCFTIAHN